MHIKSSFGLAVCFVAAVFASANIHAADYDFTVSVSSKLNLVPGQVGFLYGTLTNTGTQAVAFQDYDPNASDGFGYDFSAPGLVVNGFSQATIFTDPCGRFNAVAGRVDPITPRPFQCYFTNEKPDFSMLDNVSLAPGESITFEFQSVKLDASTPIGTTFLWRLDGFAATLGDAVGLVWENVSPHDVTIVAAASYSSENPVPVELSVSGPGSSPGENFVIEAENMYFDGGYGVEPGFGRIVIADTVNNPTGYAFSEFTGVSGNYRVEVELVNGGTGLSDVEFYVNGERFGLLYWDYSTPNPALILPNVALANGDGIVLAGYAEGDGGARVDKIVLIPQ